jgi:hypothetical protein
MQSYHPKDMDAVPESDWNPQGEARRSAAMGYMHKMGSDIPEEMREITMETSAPSEAFQRRFAEKFVDPSDIEAFRQLANDRMSVGKE